MNDALIPLFAKSPVSLARVNALADNGIAYFYVPVARNINNRWLSFWQLIEYDIDKAEILYIYPFKLRGKASEDIPSPDTQKPYITSRELPRQFVRYIKNQVELYRTNLRRDQ